MLMALPNRVTIATKEAGSLGEKEIELMTTETIWNCPTITLNIADDIFTVLPKSPDCFRIKIALSFKFLFLGLKM